MFYAHKLTKLNPQKNRTNKIIFNDTKIPHQFKNWFKVVSFGYGTITYALIAKIFTWAKRITYYPNTTSRFWVNIQISKPITRKAENSRMGKGKGSKVMMLGVVSTGTVLLALSKIRTGRRKRLIRQIQVRCAFLLGMQTPPIRLFVPFNRIKARQPYFIFNKKWDYYTIFKQTNQRELMFFFTSIFKWYTKRAALFKTPTKLVTQQPQPINYNGYLGETTPPHSLYMGLWNFSLTKILANMPLDFYYNQLAYSTSSIYSEIFQCKTRTYTVNFFSDLILRSAFYQTKFSISKFNAYFFCSRLNHNKRIAVSNENLHWLFLNQLNHLAWTKLITQHNAITLFN